MVSIRTIRGLPSESVEKSKSMPRRRMTSAEEGNVELGDDSIGGGPDAGGGRGAGIPRGKGTMPSPSPRLLSAESRLAQEKTWLKNLPIHCHAEAMRCSDFVWSFRVSGLDGTPYEVSGVLDTFPIVVYTGIFF